MRHLPLFFDTRGRRILLAGEGPAAAARLRLLARSEARLEVFAPEPGAELAHALAESGARHHRRWPRPADLAGALCLHAASGRPELDGWLARLARMRGVPVTVMDAREGGDFIMPAIVDRDPVVVAIGTGGAAPMLARMIRAALEARLPASLGPLARLADTARAEVARRVPPGAARRRLWARFFARLGPAAWTRGGAAAAAAALERLIGRAAAAPLSAPAEVIVLRGADAAILGAPARHALAEADLVLVDPALGAAAREALLRLARREARILPLGGDAAPAPAERVAVVAAGQDAAAQAARALAAAGRRVRTHAAGRAATHPAANLDRPLAVAAGEGRP